MILDYFTLGVCAVGIVFQRYAFSISRVLIRFVDFAESICLVSLALGNRTFLISIVRLVCMMVRIDATYSQYFSCFS